jgi:hypothetical protein
MSEGATLRDYLRSTWFVVGAVLLIGGASPLLFIIAAASLGLWPDPNPNPIGPGLLLLVTFWPGLICIGKGIERVRRHHRKPR